MSHIGRHSVARSSVRKERTRKIRNGKKKMMRRGRIRRHHSRNKRGGETHIIDLNNLMSHSGTNGYTIVLGDTGYSIGVISSICFLMGNDQNYYRHITKITLTTVDDKKGQFSLKVEYVTKIPTVSDNLNLKQLMEFISQNLKNRIKTFNDFTDKKEEIEFQIEQEVANKLLFQWYVKSDIENKFTMDS